MSSKSFSGLVLMSCHGQGESRGWVVGYGTLEERGWLCVVYGGLGLEVVLSFSYPTAS